MKKKDYNVGIIAVLMVFIVSLLCACSREDPGPKTIVYGENVYTVDTEAMTISEGKNRYTYQVNGTGSSVRYEISYPNGARYFWTETGNGGYGGWSDDYDETKYVDGGTLIDVLQKDMPRKSQPKNVPIIFLLMIIGIFNTAAPQTAWYLSTGWRFKNAEPSETALGLTRFGGIAAIVIAVIMMLV